MMKRLSGLVLLLCLANFLSAQDMRMDTYCNHPLAELSQCILDSSNGSIINVI